MKAKELAKLLGVSASTVSLVRNNKPGVSDAKRQEILRKMHELGLEHMLRDAQPQRECIGFVVYKSIGNIVDESPFFPYILEGISEKLESLHYNLSIFYISKDSSQEEQRAIISRANCAGLIVFAVEMRYEDMQIFKDSGLPFVMLDNSFHINDVDTVAINNAHGIYKALSHLKDRGHRHIGYIASKIVINSFTDRQLAFKRAMRMLNLVYDKNDIVHVGYSDEEARADMFSHAKESSKLPTAFVGDNDLVVCGSMKGLLDAGIEVPKDVSLIGFDDRPLCTQVIPTLTTMRIPKIAFGHSCVDLLVGRLNNKRQYGMKIEISTILKNRDSVRNIESQI